MTPLVPGLGSHAANVKRAWALVIIALIFNISGFSNPVPGNSDTLGVKTVIIDPGHGGRDPGCLGSHSHEADVALAISLKLGKMLTDRYGKALNVIFTRTTDVHVDLAERAVMANKNKGDLFICIHANSGQPEAKGSEVYALGLHKTNAQLKVAQKENSSILMEENYQTKYQHFDPNDPDAYIFLNFLTTTYLENSLNFAGKIQGYLKNTPKIIDRGVKQAGFLVLHQVNMPSVLVETAFLTNKAEEEMLNDETSQTEIAKAIFNAFVDYENELENRKKEMGDEKKDDTTDKNTTTDKTVTTDKNTTAQNPVTDKNPTSDKNITTDKTVTTDKVTPNPQAENEKDKVLFKVQVAASNKAIDLKSPTFKGLESIEENRSGDVYRYTYGKTSNFEEAKKFQSAAVAKGIKSAFITAYLNGERIDMTKALELANK